MIGSDGRMKLVMSNGGWESLRSEQREALNMVQMIFYLSTWSRYFIPQHEHSRVDFFLLLLNMVEMIKMILLPYQTS